MEKLVLRAATSGDAEAIAAIYRPAVLEGTASFEINPPAGAEMSQRMTAITTE